MSKINNNNNNSSNTTTSTTNSKNEILIKIVFPPTSPMISKAIYLQENQKASDIIQYASQLAGLQIGYGLYLPTKDHTSNSHIRGFWIDDDQILSKINGIQQSEYIQIKKRPGFKSRKNTVALLKGFKEGKVQKLSSYTKMWNPRFLKLFSQRIIHSASENDVNTNFISFADILNVDRDIHRKYTFIVTTTLKPSTLSKSTTTTSTSTSLNSSSSGNISKELKEYIFRCTSQMECEDWITQIRSLLRKSRPDLLLPPLSMNPNSLASINNIVNSNNNNNNSVNTPSPISSNTSNFLVPLSPFKVPVSNATPPLPNKNTGGSLSTPSSPSPLNHNNSQNINNNLPSTSTLPISSNEDETKTQPVLQHSRSRSFSFSLSGSKKKQSSNTPPVPLTLSERNSQLEDEIKKLKDQYENVDKSKQQLEKKYKKLKHKYTTYKKNRSRSVSTPSTPDLLRKDKFNPFIIGGNRIVQPQPPQQPNNNNNNNNNNNVTPISLNKSNGDIQQTTLHQSIVNNQYHPNQRNSMSMGGEDMTDSDLLTETFSMDTEDISDGAILEIKELKEQLSKIKDKLSVEIQEKMHIDQDRKLAEKDLFTHKKFGEKLHREFQIVSKRQDDCLEGMSEMASRLKKSLQELKEKLEKEIDDDPMDYSSYSIENEMYDDDDDYIDDNDDDDENDYNDNKQDLLEMTIPTTTT
ncbi:hypothetical protein DLAC_01793 [Tieghemostelium lacteum]|uniref:PH domain-containing protein n=1 Tax=Tieghemostelium lacteum TaxID=361077 RepID=A0A152A6N6_TIELA|nr:hypothetical protein DLAC_01793 [Tieghemostelium lacteum]|eukprot:KYR01781.1 hypothetical protein DLAC_01793 [Tieghemostelium lacteum]